jgi:hypothetical protein
MEKEILMYDLSICLAAIRKENWLRLYNSIIKSVGSYSFELVFCGPHKELPKELQGLENVSCIQDYGSPTRAQQISMQNAKGKYITWTADDGWFLEGGLSKCIKILDDNKKEKGCVVTQYIEGGTDGLGDPNTGMYYMNSHDPVRSSFYPNEFLIFNSVVLPTKYFIQLGGFDCRFEACPMAFVDFGARAQLDGIETELIGVIFECTQFPGTSGDHAPIHHAQLGHDQPLYKKIWGSSECLDRIKIDYNNWKQTPDVWTRRFGSEK